MQTMLSKTKLCMLVAASAILACSCDLVEPSVQSKNLEKQVVPRLTAWSDSGEPALKLSTVADLGDYDAVCLIPEYSCLDGVTKIRVTGGITKYYSSFGKCVPENKVALLVVLNHEAQAALLDRSGAFLNTLSYGTCAEASKAVLRRTVDLRNGDALLKIQEE